MARKFATCATAFAIALTFGLSLKADQGWFPRKIDLDFESTTPVDAVRSSESWIGNCRVPCLLGAAVAEQL